MTDMQNRGSRPIVQKEPSTGGFNDLMAVDADLDDLPPPTTAATTELGYINQVTEIVVKQGVSLRELQPQDKEPSMYIIEEKGTGEKLYKVYEDTATCGGAGGCITSSCGPNRSFKLRLMDTQDRELIQVERPYISCDYCCGITSLFDIVNVWVRNYKSKQFEWRRFGQIRQFWCPLFPYFSVRNAIGQSELSIRGPLFTSACLSPVVFSIKHGSEVVGNITKARGSGTCRTAPVPSGTDMYTLKFPPGIDEKLKVSLIGALLLIHFKFYETTCRCYRGG